LYSIALFLVKVSILLLYLRLFPSPPFILACRTIAGIMAAFLVWTVFGFMFMCMPVSYFWDRAIENGSCIDMRIVSFTNAPWNILTDFVLFTLPVKTLWKLDLPRRQKVGLVVLFTIGLV
jgi:hypothetical protein